MPSSPSRDLEEKQGGPGLDGFGGGFLIVATGRTDATGVGVPHPGIKIAQEGEIGIVAIPVGVPLGYDLEDLAVGLDPFGFDLGHIGSGLNQE